ncbi:DUF4276 family protein [Candidatus Magnetomonas plexicatena]|uniref:DUF4276 family protein n=1 Tax=Candidatus Magnetomonas plexicatena TaxID=2552947 RepID=UPI001C766C1A|nr:DUF4276 family protein [Nitrospirales bacterium LBB_01]
MNNKHILFCVEGRTEGARTIYGKGIKNILRVEVEYMRKKKIFHDVKVFNGKHEMMREIDFHVSQHLYPAKYKPDTKLEDCYVFILRDLDCENIKEIEDEINNKLSGYKNYYSIHFAKQEIEAWIVADINCFKSVYRTNAICLVKAIENIPYIVEPEKVDCDPKISERIEQIARKCSNRYRKTIEGPQLLKFADPDVVSKKCPSFLSFRNDLRKQIGFLDPI